MKLQKLFFAVLFLLFLHPATSHAQEQFKFTHTIESEYPQQPRTFTIHLPASYYVQKEFDYPTLYVLDGESNLDYSISVAEFLAENALIPEMIIIGLHAGATRARDYLPANPEMDEAAGKAALFLNYIEKELIPAVEKEYRAAPLRLISGHSMGGVFVAYTLMNGADLFQGYLTQSPYLEEAIGTPLLASLEQVVSSDQTIDAFFYMNIGNEPSLEKNYDRMESILRTAASPTFRLSADRAQGKTHMTTRLIGQYEALEDFFAEDWPLSTEKAGPGLKEHLESLSAKYGYPVLYNEQAFQQVTQSLLSAQNIPAALEAAQMYTEQYALSPIAHFLVGVSLASGGQQQEALTAINSAIELYEKNPTSKLQPVYNQMKQIRQQLGG